MDPLTRDFPKHPRSRKLFRVLFFFLRRTSASPRSSGVDPRLDGRIFEILDHGHYTISRWKISRTVVRDVIVSLDFIIWKFVSKLRDNTSTDKIILGDCEIFVSRN